MTAEREPAPSGTRDEIDDLFAAARDLAERPGGDERVDWGAVRARVRRRRAARTAAWAASAAVVAGAAVALALGLSRGPAGSPAPAAPPLSAVASPSADVPEYRLLLPDPRVRVVADRSAEVRVLSSAEVELRAGTLRVSVDASAGPVPFRVRTPSARVEVAGTRFGVRHDAAGTSVAVLEGRVRVADSGGERLLEAGTEQAAAGRAGPLGDAWRADLVQALGAPRPRIPEECRLAAADSVPPPPGPSPPPPPAVAPVPAEPPPATPDVSAGPPARENHPPPSPEDLYAQAETAMAAGRLEEAVALLERVADLERGRPLGGTALIDLGARYQRLGRGAEARATYRRYLEEQPAGAFRGEARISLCRLERRAGDPAATRACYAAYLEEEPSGPYAAEARAGAGEEAVAAP